MTLFLAPTGGECWGGADTSIYCWMMQEGEGVQQDFCDCGHRRQKVVGCKGLFWTVVRAEESSGVNGCDSHYQFLLSIWAAVGSTCQNTECLRISQAQQAQKTGGSAFKSTGRIWDNQVLSNSLKKKSYPRCGTQPLDQGGLLCRSAAMAEIGSKKGPQTEQKCQYQNKEKIKCYIKVFLHLQTRETAPERRV